MNIADAVDMSTELTELLTTLHEHSFHARDNIAKIDRLRAIANEHVQALAAFLATENFGVL